jgi:peptide/nickel transport system substrate-binding protein
MLNGVGFGLALLMATCAAGAVQAQSHLTVALAYEPPTLDTQVTTTNTVRNVAVQINEGLFALDADYKPQPVLASGYTVSDDGLTYTFALRHGVMFHNGQEMTSADVVASLTRWTKRSSFGKTLAPSIDSIGATDDYTVVMQLNKPLNLVLEALSAWPAGAFIYPASVIEAAGTGQISDYIGTGPFRFVEWHQGQDVVLQKFDGYQSPEGEASGYAGARQALVDEIRFVFVPESSVAVIGVQTGQYDVALDVDAPSRDRAASDPNVVVYRGAPRMATMALNKASGPMSNVLMRRALQAAVCTDEIMPAYGTSQDSWRADPSIMWKESAWWSEAGKDHYNICDSDRARALAAEAGYDGKPLVLDVTTSHRSELSVAQIVQQELQDAGINAELKVEDAASQEATLSQKTGWDVSFNGNIYRTHPMQLSHLQASWTGWWESEKRDQLVSQLITVPADQQKAVWDQVQQLYYDEVPIVKIGDFFQNDVVSKHVTGYQNLPESLFWNVGVDR